jgi:predicted RNase H-like HicB family nuclease
MFKHFTLTYWQENDLYSGRLKEIPEISSQGKTLEELEDNIQQKLYDLIINIINEELKSELKHDFIEKNIKIKVE